MKKIKGPKSRTPPTIHHQNKKKIPAIKSRILTRALRALAGVGLSLDPEGKRKATPGLLRLGACQFDIDFNFIKQILLNYISDLWTALNQFQFKKRVYINSFPIHSKY